MVMQYGMSQLGRINFKDERSSAFLMGSSSLEARRYSEATAEKIDAEVRDIIDTALNRVRDVLTVRKAALQAITDRLIEVEAIDSDELKQIIEANLPGPMLVPGTDGIVRKKPGTAEPAVDNPERQSSEN
jgi:cell division protease FtsH